MYLFIVQRSLMPRNAMLHYAAKEGREELRAALSDMPLSLPLRSSIPSALIGNGAGTDGEKRGRPCMKLRPSAAAAPSRRCQSKKHRQGSGPPRPPRGPAQLVCRNSGHSAINHALIRTNNG